MSYTYNSGNNFAKRKHNTQTDLTNVGRMTPSQYCNLPRWRILAWH